MRTHYLLNVTWRCQNRCRYCWLNPSVRTRPEMLDAEERPAADWIAAIHRDRPGVVDIAGGEPFLYEGLLDIIAACPETHFGLSTNGISARVLDLTTGAPLQNVVSINVSYHPDAQAWQGYEPTWRRHVASLRAAHYRVHTNIVDHGDNVERAADTLRWLRGQGIHVAISPYEESAGLGEQLAQGLVCQGGIAHLNVAPDGEAWPCLTTMRSPYWEETRLGNWLDGAVDVARKPVPCHLACHDYYVLRERHEAGDMWGVAATPAPEGQP